MERREDGWENEQTPYLVMPAATTFSDDNLVLKVRNKNETVIYIVKISRRII